MKTARFPLCALLLIAQPLHATILGGAILQQTGTGRFVILPADVPLTVGNDSFDDDNLYAFDEDQNIEIAQPIRVDIGGSDGLIPAGTVVASHYVFFDSVNGFHVGHVDFDAPILGVATFQDTMGATDYLANTAVTYLSENLRGLETGDEVWIDDTDPHRLWVSWAGSSPGDYIRVFTERSHAALMM